MSELKSLREAGYEVATTTEDAHPGMKNEELARLSIQLRRTIKTRDADFTHSGKSLIRKN